MPYSPLFSAVPLPFDGDLKHWWQSVKAEQLKAQPIALAIAGGAQAQTPGLAFLAGYQSALRRLWPQAPEGLGALCVTEKRSTRPADLSTRLENGCLSGTKDFVTAGSQADWLLVAAREEGAGEKPQIALAQLAGSSVGVSVENLPALPIMSEISHGRVLLGQAMCQRLPGDGWNDYVKPFRTLEDTFVLSALCAWLIAVGRRSQWPQVLELKLLGLLAGCVQVAESDANAPVTHLLLAGLFAQYQGLSAEVDQAFAQSEAPLSKLWARDKNLLMLAQKARDKRLENAWASLLPA